MNYKVSYQLYSSRNFPPLEAQLPILKQIGYDAIEPWLPAYDTSARNFRRALDAAGLVCIGFHMPLTGLTRDTDRFIDIAHDLGASLMIPPWIAPEDRDTGPDGWRRLGEALADGARKVRSAGLRVAWHNHDFEYRRLGDGSRPIDLILEAAGPDVGFEIDCGWIVRGGADPAAELARYADRIWAIQVKDTAPFGTEQDDGWTATGDGIIDWAKLWPLFLRTNADHFVVEHDNPSDWQSFARRSLACVHTLMARGGAQPLGRAQMAETGGR
jgi:sugar phosphate isomerase/epimerase